MIDESGQTTRFNRIDLSMMTKKRRDSTNIPKRVRFDSPISSKHNYQPNTPTRPTRPLPPRLNTNQVFYDIFKGIYTSLAMIIDSFRRLNNEVQGTVDFVKMDESITVTSEGVEYEVSTYELMKLLFQDEYEDNVKKDPPGTPADGNAELNINVESGETESTDDVLKEDKNADEEAGLDDNQDNSDDDNKTTSSMSTFHQIATLPPANGRTYHDPDKDFVGAAMEAAITATSRLATCISWEAAASSPSLSPKTCLPSSKLVPDSVQAQTKNDLSAPAPSNALSVVDPVALQEYATAADPCKRQSLKEMITEQILVGLGFKPPKKAGDEKKDTRPDGNETIKGEKASVTAVEVMVQEDHPAEENVVTEESKNENENESGQNDTDEEEAHVTGLDAVERDAIMSDFEELVWKNNNEHTAHQDSWSKSGTNSLLQENEDELSSTINKNHDVKAEILKAIVIKCLVRNHYASKMNHRKSNFHVHQELQVHSKNSLISNEASERDVTRDPSTEGFGVQGERESDDKRDADVVDRVKPCDPPETGTSDRSHAGLKHSTIPRHISTYSYPRGDRSVASSIPFPRPETRPKEWRRPIIASSNAVASVLGSSVPRSVQRQIAIDQERAKLIFNKYSSSPAEARSLSQRPFKTSVAVSTFSPSVPSYGAGSGIVDREKANDIINESAMTRRRRYKDQLMKERNERRYATE